MTTEDRNEDQKKWSRALEPLVTSNDGAGTLFRLRGLDQQRFPILVAKGVLYEYGGDGIEQDFGEAKKCYEKALREEPYAMALHGLGRLYFFGRGVPRDLETSRSYYSRLEENGDAVAQLMLGQIAYVHDEDLALARSHFKLSSSMGNLIAAKHLTQVDIKEGRLISGLLRRAKAILDIFAEALRDQDSPALRSE